MESTAMPRPAKRSLCASLLLAAPFAAPALAQNAPPAAPPAASPQTAADVVVHKPACIGADPTATIFFAKATAGGKREEFGPIAKETAFELWLDDNPPVKAKVDAPDPDHPGQTKATEVTRVAVYPISIAEFQGYCDYIRTIAPIADESGFVLTALNDLLEQRAVHLYYLDALPKVKGRVAMAVDRLERGIPFEKVVKQNTEDDTGRQSGGQFGDDLHGAYIGRYPMEIVLFSMKPGDLVGPIFDKYAAYVMRCDERVQSPADPRKDRVKTRAICIRYAQNSVLSGADRQKLLNSVRLRTDQERFRRILPPAVQVPPLTSFGPDDIAPIGQPDAPLKQRSLDDEHDNKPKSDH
jgi:hypothetical protein